MSNKTLETLFTELNWSTTMPERFWSKVRKGSGCWEWTGYIGTHGYGMIANGKQPKIPTVSHRVSWVLNRLSIPAEFILHKCDNRKCVNPDHLFEGSPLANIADMIAKGRSRASVSLTEGDIIRIREIWNTGMVKQTEIAKLFKVHASHISRIVRFETRLH